MPLRSPLAGRSLTARLALTSVALVALVSLLVVTVNALTLHRSLMGRLDDDLRGAAVRAMGGPEADDQPPGRRGGWRGGDGDIVQGPGTLLASLADGGSSGVVIERSGARETLPDDALEALGDVEPRERPETVDVPGYGEYRVVATSPGDRGAPTDATIVVGLPAGGVDAVVASAVVREVGVALVAVLLAGLVGVAVVRRQLRPLREVAATAHSVAAMPLSQGEVGVTARVPDRLTDTRTEVGQVGAALNVLLGRVEGALDDRHRSEQQVRRFVADASRELRTPLATEDVDLTMLVVETVADARVLSPDHHWRLRLPDDPVVVVGDGQRIRQVLTNLTSNARRHTPAGTTVSVWLERDAAQARITVADDGPGVPLELRPTIFERFTRADVARSRQGAGVGLGLSLARAIARAHGGDVTLDSRPGATAFTLTLPAPGEPEYLER